VLVCSLDKTHTNLLTRIIGKVLEFRDIRRATPGQLIHRRAIGLSPPNLIRANHFSTAQHLKGTDKTRLPSDNRNTNFQARKFDKLKTGVPTGRSQTRAGIRGGKWGKLERKWEQNPEL